MPATTDLATVADDLVAAYNAKDFDALERLLAPDLDFAHLNRGFAMTSRDELLGVLRHFATTLAPDRRFEAPLRVTTSGDVVVRESFWVATAAVDIPGFADAGGAIRTQLCTVLRFDDAGRVAEWKDYG